MLKKIWASPPWGIAYPNVASGRREKGLFLNNQIEKEMDGVIKMLEEIINSRQ